MKRKIVVIGVILLILASATMADAGRKLKACKVSIPIIENVFVGAESITFAPTFAVQNPNKSMIILKRVDYEVHVGDFFFGGQSMPLNLYIPAKGEIRLSSAFPIDWVSMSLWLMQIKGVDMGAAMAEVAKTWKSLNGKLFNPKLQEVWDKVTPERPVFVIKGRIEIESESGQKLESDYSANWQHLESD